MKPLGITPLGLAVIIIITAWVFFFLGQAIEHRREMRAESRRWAKEEKEFWEQEDDQWRKDNAHKSVKP